MLKTAQSNFEDEPVMIYTERPIQFAHPAPQLDSDMYEQDDDIQSQMFAEQDSPFTYVKVKEQIVPVDDSQYDRVDYLTRLASEYDRFPSRAHGYYNWWNQMRPAKHEREYPPWGDVTARRLPIPGHFDEDRTRQFFKAPRHDHGSIDADGQPVIGTALGLIATPPMTKYELARAPRSMREEVEAYKDVNKAPDVIKGRAGVLTPQFGAAVGGRPRIGFPYLKMGKEEIETYYGNDEGCYEEQFNPDFYRSDPNQRDTAVWRKKFLGDVRTTETEKAGDCYGINRTHARPIRRNQLVTNGISDRPDLLIEGTFLDPTMHSQRPTITAATSKAAYPIIGEIARPRHKGCYEMLNRRANADNTSFVGASYVYYRGPNNLVDTSYKSYEPGPGFKVPARIDPSHAPITPQYEGQSRFDWYTTLAYGRENNNEKLILTPDLFQNNYRLTREEEDNVLDTTAAMKQYLAPPLHFLERRPMEVYSTRKEETPFPSMEEP